MSRSPHRPPLSADRPIGDPADDRLGHARFAADIARCVAEMTPDDPLVLGLHGSPGSGRTSVLNMVRRQLEAAGVRVHEINPWVHGPALADVLADRVEAAAGDRVVVMMDDVDRLTVGEWAQLTRLVERSLAVPGAAYVLVFDRSESDPVELGRLVQVPFDLPLPEGDSLSVLLLERLQEVLAESTSADVVSESHWEQVFRPGIERLIQTPRDVTLLTNALRVTFPPVSLEVNAADFIAIQAIRIFLPRLYDTIRRNPDRFAGRVRTVAVAGAPAEARDFHDAWSDALPAHADGDAVRTMMLRLFPTVPDFPGTVTQRDASGSGLRRLLRVGSREIFPIYFSLAVPARAVSHVELAAVMGQLGDRGAFAEALLQAAGVRGPAGISHARTLLSRIAEEVAAVDPAAVRPGVEALLETGDEIVRADPATIEPITRVVTALLRRVDEPARDALLSELSPQAPALSVLTALAGELGGEHGRRGAVPHDGPRTLTEPHLDGLEGHLSERLREAAQSGAIATLPLLADVLDRWLAWDRSECMRWTTQVPRDERALVALLEAFLLPGTAGPRADLERLSRFANPSLIAPAVRRLAAGGGAGQTAAAAFMGAFETGEEAVAV